MTKKSFKKSSGRDNLGRFIKGHTFYAHPNAIKTRFSKGKRHSPETEFKKGEKVPDTKAELWMSMYKISPVEKIGKSTDKNEDKKSKGEESTKEESPADKMIDDYLNRNAGVVINNLKEDNHDGETLEKLLTKESTGKKRKSVIEELKDQMKTEVK